jgi:hypothetical protein
MRRPGVTAISADAGEGAEYAALKRLRAAGLIEDF